MLALCLLILTFLWKLKEDSLFCLSDEYIWFKCSYEKVLCKKSVIQTVQQKNLWKSSVLVKVLYAYSFIDNEFLLRYFQGFC